MELQKIAKHFEKRILLTLPVLRDQITFIPDYRQQTHLSVTILLLMKNASSDKS